MRKRLFAIVLALTAAVGISGGTASGAVRSAQVDTITMDAEMPDDEVEVDLGWKTQQDKGRWIDKMGIGDDVNSLLLIINNLDTETDTVKTTKDHTSGEKVVRSKRKQLPGNSRLLYLSRTDGRKIFRSTAMFPVDRMMIPRRMAFTVWKAPSEVKMIRAALYRTGNLRKTITGSRIRKQPVSA